MGDVAIILLTEEEADEILSELNPEERAAFKQLAEYFVQAEIQSKIIKN